MARDCKKLPFHCGTCKKSFSTKYILSQHILRQHNAFLPFHCKVCFKKFMHLSSLQQHTKIHSEHAPYKCKICGQEFSESSQIAKHKIFHNQQSWRRCHKCGRVFALQHQLTYHLWKAHRLMFRKLTSEIRLKTKVPKRHGIKSGVLKKQQSGGVLPSTTSKASKRKRSLHRANGKLNHKAVKNTAKLNTGPSTCCIKANLSPTKLILKYKDKTSMTSHTKNKLKDKNLFESFANINGMNNDLSLKGCVESDNEIKSTQLVCEMDSSENKIKLKISNTSDSCKNVNPILNSASNSEGILSHIKKTRFSTESGIDVVFDSSETSTPEHSSGVDVQTSDSGLECNLVACKKLEFKNRNPVCDENRNQGNSVNKADTVSTTKPTLTPYNKVDSKRNIFQVLEEETNVFRQSSKSVKKPTITVNDKKSAVVIDSSESEEDLEIREVYLDSVRESKENNLLQEKQDAYDSEEDLEIREISTNCLQTITESSEVNEKSSVDSENQLEGREKSVPEQSEIGSDAASHKSSVSLPVEPTGVIIDDADLKIDSLGTDHEKKRHNSLKHDNFQCAFLQYVSGNGKKNSNEPSASYSPELPNSRTTSMAITKRRNVETLMKKYKGQGLFINISKTEEPEEELDIGKNKICSPLFSEEINEISKRTGKKRNTRSGECKVSSSNESDNGNDSDSRLGVRRKKKRLRTRSCDLADKKENDHLHTDLESNQTSRNLRQQPSRRVRKISYNYDSDSSDLRSDIEENGELIKYDCQHENVGSDSNASTMNSEESQAEDELSEDSAVILAEKDPDWAPSSKVMKNVQKEPQNMHHQKVSPHCVKNKTLSHKHSSHKTDSNDNLRSRTGRKRSRTKGMCPCCIGVASPVKKKDIKPASSLKRGRFKYLSAMDERNFINYTRHLISARWLFHRLLCVLFPQKIPLLRKINPESMFFDSVVDEVEEILKCNDFIDPSQSILYENSHNSFQQESSNSGDSLPCEDTQTVSNVCAIHARLPTPENGHKSHTITSPLNIIIPENHLCYHSDRDSDNYSFCDRKTLNKACGGMSEMEEMLQQCINQCSDISSKCSNCLVTSGKSPPENCCTVGLLKKCESCEDCNVTNISGKTQFPVFTNDSVCVSPNHSSSLECKDQSDYAFHSDENFTSNSHPQFADETELELDKNCEVTNSFNHHVVSEGKLSTSPCQNTVNGTLNDQSNTGSEKDNKPAKPDNIFDIFKSSTYCMKCGIELFTTYETLCPDCKDSEGCSKKIDKPSNGLSSKKDLLQLITCNAGDNKLNSKLQSESQSVLDKLSALVKSDSNSFIETIDSKRKSSASSETVEEVGPSSTDAISGSDVMFPVTGDTSHISIGFDSSQVACENDSDNSENTPLECIPSNNFTSIASIDSDETIEASLNKDLNVSDLTQICEARTEDSCDVTSGQPSLTENLDSKAESVSTQQSSGDLSVLSDNIKPCKVNVCKSPVRCLSVFKIKMYSIITQLFPEYSFSSFIAEKPDSLEYLLRSLIDSNVRCTCDLNFDSNDRDQVL